MKVINEKTDIWNAVLYDDKHSFVTQYGKDLIELLAPCEGEQILDIGCGTGDLAFQIHQLGANVIGIDNSEAMIKQCQIKYPEISFETIDAREMKFNNQFDAVFSNAALHWMQPPDIVLKNIWSALKFEGRFIAEFGGKNNVNSIVKAIITAADELNCDRNLIKSPWFFPSLGEYTFLMEKNGFQVNYALYYDRPTKLDGEDGLKNWITMFGGSLLSNIPKEIRECICEKAEKALESQLLKDGTWVADYKRLRVFGKKKN